MNKNETEALILNVKCNNLYFIWHLFVRVVSINRKRINSSKYYNWTRRKKLQWNFEGSIWSYHLQNVSHFVQISSIIYGGYIAVTHISAIPHGTSSHFSILHQTLSIHGDRGEPYQIPAAFWYLLGLLTWIPTCHNGCMIFEVLID